MGLLFWSLSPRKIKLPLPSSFHPDLLLICCFSAMVREAFEVLSSLPCFLSLCSPLFTVGVFLISLFLLCLSSLCQSCKPIATKPTCAEQVTLFSRESMRGKKGWSLVRGTVAHVGGRAKHELYWQIQPSLAWMRSCQGDGRRGRHQSSMATSCEVIDDLVLNLKYGLHMHLRFCFKIHEKENKHEKALGKNTRDWNQERLHLCVCLCTFVCTLTLD